MTKPKDKRRRKTTGVDAMESETMARNFGGLGFVSFEFDKHKSKQSAKKDAKKFRDSHKDFKEPSKHKGRFKARITKEKGGHRVWKRIEEFKRR